MYEYKVTIDRVVDGDTVDIWIDLGFDVRIFERVRMAGIDTPESRTRDAREKKFGKMATARVEELLPVGGKFWAVSKSYASRGKFGRAMMDFRLPDNQMLCQVLLNEMLAVLYHGQNKKDIRAEHEANWDFLENKEVPEPKRSRTCTCNPKKK